MLRFWASVAVGFLISARPASMAGLTAASVRLSPEAVLVELKVFKNGTSGSAQRVSLYIPTAGDPDSIRRLFRRLLSNATRPDAPWFCLHDLSLAAAAGLHAVTAVAPRHPLYSPLLAERGNQRRVRGRSSYEKDNAREQSRVRGRRAPELPGSAGAADARFTCFL
jgi:hypothetical protein